jgi:hypothetical protein
MSLLARMEGWSTRRWINAACVLSLVGLACMVVSVILPWPIPVVFAMSVGQLIGILGFASYAVAVVFEALLQRRAGSSHPPADDKTSQ